MDEKTVTMMEGVAREWRVRVMDSAGNVLNPEGFSFYGAAADGVQVPRRMQVRVEGDVVVLVLPGLWMRGRCWRYQLLCQDVLTGVEWVLCQGDVVLERRVACNGPALHEDAVLVDAVLDSELEQVDVYLGDSTAASAEAARLAVAAREGADEAAARVAGDAARVEELKGAVLDVAAGAALAAERAEDSKRGAEAAAGAAAADAQVAAGKAAAAEVSREGAEAAAKLAGARAAEAEARAKVAADAVSDALGARDEAAAARGGAEAALRAAGARAGEAEVSADAAGVARAGAEAALGRAEAAKAEAEAALGRAEEQAANATAAAAAAQAPESIAAQAARPATMLLVRDELMSILDDASLYDLDTDGQKIIVHTDRLSDDKLAAVTDILERFVPLFIEFEQYNHHIEVSWRDINKYAECVTAEDLYNANPSVNQNNEQSGNGYQFQDICSDGAIPYAFNELSSIGTMGVGYGKTIFDNLYLHGERIKKMELHMPSLPGWGGNCYFEELILDAPNLKYFTENYVKGLKRFRCNSLLIERIDNLAWQSKLESIECDFSKLKSGKICDLGRRSNILNKASVLRICNTVPPWTKDTHELWLGIHIDHQNDEKVLDAIAAAEKKGWKLTVQWNPGGPTYTTPEASTMAMGTLIYAKVSEIELPDGTTERVLNWGHYVTNWEERGYEQFRSLESAYRYFNLPEPEETLTETE